MSDCIFCKNLPKVMENDLAYAIYDISPVSKGHALIVTRRHFENFFDTTVEENAALRALILAMRQQLDLEHHPDGYNIWMNCGAAAGQVVMHTHIHLIPRYAGEPIHIKSHLKGNIE